MKFAASNNTLMIKESLKQNSSELRCRIETISQPPPRNLGSNINLI